MKNQLGLSIGLKICGDNAIKEFHAPPPQVGGVSGSVNTQRA